MASVVICAPPGDVRDRLAAKVASVPRVSEVRWTSEPAAVADTAAALSDAVILLDSTLCGERLPAVVTAVLGRNPRAGVLILTMGTDPDRVAAGVQAGARGYVASDAAIAELAVALAPLVAGAATDMEAPDEVEDSAAAALLTQREFQVLEGMSRGRSNSQIGAELYLSEDTVKTHARRMFRKLGVNDRAHAVAEGLRRGILPRTP